jgi:hypothetical protein
VLSEFEKKKFWVIVHGFGVIVVVLELRSQSLCFLITHVLV